MLVIEKSFFVQHWEFFLISLIFVFFAFRLKENFKSSKTKSQFNDEDIIENDAKHEENGTDDDLTPSLEDVDHIPFSGASVVLNGGAQEFLDMARDRRSIRNFSRKPVDIEIVKKCIHAAGTAPSGAHTEPWTFCLVQR